MKQLWNTRFIMISFFLISTFFIGYFVYSGLRAEPTEEKLVQRGYSKIGKMGEVSSCLRSIPECGTCLGVVLNGYCYEKK